MPNPTRAQAIKHMLTARTVPDLAALYHAGMETQVNVAQDDGQAKDGYSGKGKGTYTDGVETWYTFRCPENAWNEPKDNSDKEMTYSLADHADAIGMTGWCFSERRSLWFGYDFDAIVGHSTKHKKVLTDEQLAEVSAKAQALPWVQVRRSTSGSGLHLYVYLEVPEPTKNHDEHAALGRAVLGMMSSQVGFDFEAKVDACGGNLWVWGRKQKGTNGLTIVKHMDHRLATLPAGWRQHLRVIKGERKKTLPEFAMDDAAGFDEMAGQMPRVPLDEEHQKLVTFLQNRKSGGWWDADHHMLVTHTGLLEEAHEVCGFKGKFQTISDKTNMSDQNCYMFPTRGGSWIVRRYTKGVAEAPSWEQDGRGYTKCYFNKEPDLRTAARASEGTETAQGAFAFTELALAIDALKLLGGALEGPNCIINRQAKIAPHKDGKRVVVEVEHDPKDRPDDLKGWYLEKGKWRTVVLAPNLTTAQEGEVGLCDDLVRHASTESSNDAGWFVRVEARWNHEPKSHIDLALLSTGRKAAEVKSLMGASVLKPWVLVNRPFQDEYPGDRTWNRSKAQFRYPKSEEVGEFPHWNKIYEHCGEGLNDALAVNGWAQANGVKTGADYLKLWLASVFQDPYAPLPYLFLFGNQDCGKSIFHESIDLLITGGMVETNTIFEKDEKINSSLEGAVVCVIEEMNLKKNKKAYERVKNWVTAQKLTIRRMYMDPYELPNSTHWIHSANDFEAVPVFPGDTRVTMISVPDLSAGQMIPKAELMEKLRKEAPHFLNYLLSLDIPPSGSRLRVPVVTTSEKEFLARTNRTSLEAFLEEHTFVVSGEILKFAEFFERFQATLEAEEAGEWGKHTTSKAMPPHLPVGRRGGDTCIGNLSWTPQSGAAKKKLVVRNKLLVSTEVPCKDGKCVKLYNHAPPHVDLNGVTWK